VGEGRGSGRGQEVMRQGVAGMRHTFASIVTVISAMALGNQQRRPILANALH